MEKIKRNIIFNKHGKQSPNIYNCKIAIPTQMIKELGFNLEDKEAYIYREDGKIIIEKVNN